MCAWIAVVGVVAALLLILLLLFRKYKPARSKQGDRLERKTTLPVKLKNVHIWGSEFSMLKVDLLTMLSFVHTADNTSFSVFQVSLDHRFAFQILMK